MAAMLEVVAEKGYPETTVADVLARAGVSRATFYQLFSDKEQCFLAMYRELVRATVDFVEQASDRGDSWSEKVELGLEALLRFLSANGAVAKVAIVDALAAGDQARSHYREGVRSFVPLVEAGKEVGDGSVPPTAGIVVVGGVMQTVSEYVANGRADDLPQLLPDLVFMVSAPFLGPERAVALKDAAARRTSEGRRAVEAPA